jgi:hypothetical protein
VETSASISRREMPFEAQLTEMNGLLSIVFVGWTLVSLMMEGRTSDVPGQPTPRHQRASRHPTAGRLFVRWFGVLCLPATAVIGLSYFNAMRAAGNVTAFERSVEWLRSHHYGSEVSWIEHVYYAHSQPRRGGTVSNLPRAVSNGATPSARTDSIAPLAGSPVTGEGVWQPFGNAVTGTAAMQVAYLRPDAIHGTVLAAVVRIDQSAARFRLVPGLQEPGHGPWPDGNRVSPTDSRVLLAAFNSGFRIADARGGFFERGTSVGQLRSGAASLVIAKDGALNIAQWGRDASASDAPIAVRQNLDLIVDAGKPVPGLHDNVGNRWGKTVGNELYVWRSGVGVDAAGRVLYAASSGLSVETLASLLQRAGAVRAMELDINHSWVSFNVFLHDPSGQIGGTKLLAGMSKPATRFLGPDSRDFIAVIARRSLSAG